MLGAVKGPTLVAAGVASLVKGGRQVGQGKKDHCVERCGKNKWVQSGGEGLERGKKASCEVAELHPAKSKRSIDRMKADRNYSEKGRKNSPVPYVSGSAYQIFAQINAGEKGGTKRVTCGQLRKRMEEKNPFLGRFTTPRSE